MSDLHHQRDTAMHQTSKIRSGFTLVEILVVLVIIGLMGAMVLAAVRGVNTTARASRTRTIIAACDSVIQEQYESYKYRPLPVEIPIQALPGPSVTYALEVLATEAARVRLIMTRDLQRMEMPDKALDVVNFTVPGTYQDTDTIPPSTAVQPPVSITAVANQVAADANGRIVRQYNNRAQRSIAWKGSRKLDTYFERYKSSGKTWTYEHQDAECLYLIMATSFLNGSAALDSIPSSNIGDTDGDGMPEILDGWGRPLGFIRWPVGFRDNDLVNVTIPDDFDLFRVDFGFIVPDSDPPWSMRPLIFSRGGDDEFGITPTSNVVEYNKQSWPLTDMDTGSTTKVGNENIGRTGTYMFPDPYVRKPTITPLPGSVFNTVDAADNITNYTLEGSQ